MNSLKELMDLRGRVAVVTGGAGNIGLAICESLAELGAQVCVFDIAAGRAAERADQIRRRFGVAASATTLDITREVNVEQSVHNVLDTYGRIDVLINNAAYYPGIEPRDGLWLDEQNLAQWNKQIEVVLTGTFLVTRACAKALAAHGCGAIVNIASVYGLVGPVPSLYQGTTMVNEAHYAAGKGGIVQLTRYLATMMAPAVRVNCLAPGGVLAGQPETFQEMYKARTPLGRMARIEDFKGAIAYLATDLSAYVTGQILAVDGGWTAW